METPQEEFPRNEQDKAELDAIGAIWDAAAKAFIARLKAAKAEKDLNDAKPA